MVQKTYVHGLICASIASAAYGLNPLFALPLYKRGFDVCSVLSFRYMIGAGLLALYVVLFRQCKFRVHRREIIPLVSCGLLMAMSSLTLYTSYNYMDVGIASTLLFVSPVMVGVIMWAFFHERMSLVMASCMAMALAGVAILNWSGGNVSVLGVLIVMVSALTWALYLIVIRRTPLIAEQAHAITMYSLLFGFPVFICMLRGGIDLRVPAEGFEWLLLFLMAAIPTIVSMFASALAVQYVGPTVTAIFGALEPLTAVLIGIFVFGEAFTVNLAIGFVLIVAAVSILACKK